MDSRFKIVNSLDPKCLELEALGYTVVGESWGAHLRLIDPIDLNKYSEKISILTVIGYRVEALPLAAAQAVLEHELLNNPDYPYTPATSYPPPTNETITNLWQAGNWIFGAFHDELLIGVVAASKKEKYVSIDFASVRKEYRGLGVGAAISSLAIITYANLGERRFSTGGAAVNEASQATVRSLGFVVDEQWRSYESPL